MGGKGGPTDQQQAQQQQVTSGELAIAGDQNARSGKLFNLTEPGLKTAESFYQKLASGDPEMIARAVAPASEAIISNTDAVKRQISDSMPRGGERNLALEEADISRAGQVGTLETQAYLGSFPALANLAGQGIGLSNAEVTSAISAFGGASQSNQAAVQQQQAAKEAQLGFIGGLAGDAAKVGASAVTKGA